MKRKKREKDEITKVDPRASKSYHRLISCVDYFWFYRKIDLVSVLFYNIALAIASDHCGHTYYDPCVSGSESQKLSQLIYSLLLLCLVPL